MLGYVNNAFEGWVTESHGAETWKRIARRLDMSAFVGPEEYDDAVTSELAEAVASETGLRVEDLLGRVGEFLGRSAFHGLRVLLDAGGSDFRELVHRLPDLRTRLELIAPAILPQGRPRRFSIATGGRNSLSIIHFSSRPDLSPLFAGTLTGLASMFGIDARVSARAVSSEIGPCQEYRVQWRARGRAKERKKDPKPSPPAPRRRRKAEARPAAH